MPDHYTLVGTSSEMTLMASGARRNTAIEWLYIFDYSFRAACRGIRRRHQLIQDYHYFFAVLGRGAILSAVVETSWMRLGPTVTTAIPNGVDEWPGREEGQLVLLFLKLREHALLTCSDHLCDDGSSNLLV